MAVTQVLLIVTSQVTSTAVGLSEALPTTSLPEVTFSTFARVTFASLIIAVRTLLLPIAVTQALVMVTSPVTSTAVGLLEPFPTIRRAEVTFSTLANVTLASSILAVTTLSAPIEVTPSRVIVTSPVTAFPAALFVTAHIRTSPSVRAISVAEIVSRASKVHEAVVPTLRKNPSPVASVLI